MTLYTSCAIEKCDSALWHVDGNATLKYLLKFDVYAIITSTQFVNRI